MKKIPLTQGQEAIVDDWWYEKISQHKYSARWNPHTKSFYAMRHDDYYVNGVRVRKTVYMHREISNTPKGAICDHISHDTLDNQEHNLRNVTNSQNSMNRKGAQSDNKLGILGIVRSGKKFRAHIKVNGARPRFRNRETIEEAIADRREAEKKHHGKFSGSK